MSTTRQRVVPTVIVHVNFTGFCDIYVKRTQLTPNEEIMISHLKNVSNLETETFQHLATSLIYLLNQDMNAGYTMADMEVLAQNFLDIDENFTPDFFENLRENSSNWTLEDNNNFSMSNCNVIVVTVWG
jgi:hypothetical protein